MLTKRQHDLLQFIAEHIRDHGYSPSYEEMMIAMDLGSKSGIHRMVKALAERGFIHHLPDRARSIEVVHVPPGMDISGIATLPVPTWRRVVMDLLVLAERGAYYRRAAYGKDENLPDDAATLRAARVILDARATP